MNHVSSIKYSLCFDQVYKTSNLKKSTFEHFVKHVIYICKYSVTSSFNYTTHTLLFISINHQFKSEKNIKTKSTINRTFTIKLKTLYHSLKYYQSHIYSKWNWKSNIPDGILKIHFYHKKMFIWSIYNCFFRFSSIIWYRDGWNKWPEINEGSIGFG